LIIFQVDQENRQCSADDNLIMKEIIVIRKIRDVIARRQWSHRT
jgi:hypothetical protein